MNQSEQYPQRYDDEISLVDLAKIFVRRRRIFYVIFLMVLVAGIAFVFLKKEVPSTTYSTMIRLAELPVFGNDGENSNQNRRTLNNTTERVATILATINSRWLPEAQSRYQAGGENWPAGIGAESVVGTELIRLTTTGINLTEGSVKQAHQTLADLIVNEQNVRLASRVTLLKNQIANLDQVIENLGPESVVAAKAIETRTGLQQKLATGEPAAVLSLARDSAVANSGPSIKLVLVLSIFLGLMLGIFAAFMAEFVSYVRKEMVKNDP